MERTRQRRRSVSRKWPWIALVLVLLGPALACERSDPPDPGEDELAEASQNGTRFTPVAVIGWRSGPTLFLRVPGNDTNDWSNAEARAALRTMVSSHAATFKPALLFLGNESDFYAGQNPTDYVRWIAACNEAYDAVKAASPGARVGPVFDVEHRMGWGAFSGWTTPHTEAFTLHDRSRINVVGLTVYPYLGRGTPAEVPANELALRAPHGRRLARRARDLRHGQPARRARRETSRLRRVRSPPAADLNA